MSKFRHGWKCWWMMISMSNSQIDKYNQNDIHFYIWLEIDFGFDF